MQTLDFRPVDGDALDRSARAADRTVERIQDAQQSLHRGDTLGVANALGEANEDAQSVSLLLTGMGASAGEGSARPLDVPLAKLGSPAMLRLLDALQFAVVCARDADEELGWTLPDGTGTGLTDSVGDLYANVRALVQGPAGRE